MFYVICTPHMEKNRKKLKGVESESAYQVGALRVLCLIYTGTQVNIFEICFVQCACNAQVAYLFFCHRLNKLLYVHLEI